jgi:hypothetical protein
MAGPTLQLGDPETGLEAAGVPVDYRAIGGERLGQALLAAELLRLATELSEVGCRILSSRRPCARGEEQKRDDGEGEAFDDWRRRSCPRDMRKPWAGRARPVPGGATRNLR